MKRYDKNTYYNKKTVGEKIIEQKEVLKQRRIHFRNKVIAEGEISKDQLIVEVGGKNNYYELWRQVLSEYSEWIEYDKLKKTWRVKPEMKLELKVKESLDAQM